MLPTPCRLQEVAERVIAVGGAGSEEDEIHDPATRPPVSRRLSNSSEKFFVNGTAALPSLFSCLSSGRVPLSAGTGDFAV